MSGIARLFVNDVEVGSLPEEQYLSILGQVKSEHRHYLMAVLRLLWSGWSAIMVALGCFSPLLITIVALLVWGAPNESAEFIDSVQKATPLQIVELLKILLTAFFMLSLVVLGTMIFVGYNFGYISPWKDARNKRLRRVMEVPTKGDFVVVVERSDDANKA
jgi:hypothetical protein